MKFKPINCDLEMLFNIKRSKENIEDATQIGSATIRISMAIQLI